MTTELTLRITDLSRGGAGVGRDPEGRVIFVPFSAPGDLLRVQITHSDKRYAQADILEVVEPSSQRQAPKCQVFGKCGGCQWQHLPYELQWKAKFQGVLHALQRVQVQVPEQLEQIPAEKIWEYRNRVQLRGFQKEIGFFRPQSQELVPIQRCEIAHSLINESLEETLQEGENLPRAYKVEIEVLPEQKIRKIWNSRHSAGGFRQVHDEQNERLRSWIRDSMAPSKVLYDLFGGFGNLSFPLIPKFEKIHCVDLSVPTTKPEGTPAQYYFHKSPVLKWVLRQVERERTKTTLGQKSAILDPPREGLGSDFKDIAPGLEALGVTEIVAVGCDPDAWARDLSRWIKRSWKLEKMMVIDLFPQTVHVESVALLRRNC